MGQGPVLDKELLAKLADAEGKLEKLDGHFEYLAQAAEKSEMLTQANRTQKKEKKVLARSLKEIDFTYQKSKQRLERDLNKMESQINQMRDTRERIEIKHLKFSDIAQREFNKIMPNDLTQKYSRSVPRAVASAMHNRAEELLRPSEDDNLSSMEQIR